jgi:hypothetical protein
MFKSTATSPSLFRAAAAVFLMVSLFLALEQQPSYSAFASQHVHSRTSRMLYDTDVSHALFKPTMELKVTVETSRNNALMSHIQSRLQRRNNRIEDVIGIVNTTMGRVESQQEVQKQPSMTSSRHHSYIVPQSAA